METDVLSEFGLAPDDVVGLGGSERSRLLNFLLRWGYVEALDACLDILLPLNSSLVSLLDLRTRAFLAQGRLDDALQTIKRRLQLRPSLTGRSLLARVHLARDEVVNAHQIALDLTREQEDSVSAWNLLGEVELSVGDLKAALNAYRHLNELAPDSRAYLMGMVAVYQSQQDWVAASGYAVRLLGTAEQDAPLTVTYLCRLRDYFRASGEATRAADLAAELEHRFDSECSELRALFGCPGRVQPQLSLSREVLAPVPPESGLGQSPVPFEQISVSPEEKERILDAARRFFRFESLLPGQLETMACVMRGEDVLTILPTGGGKSLCYQLPAVMAGTGTTLVISPLIALMKDQIDSLPEGLRDRATTINSSLDGDELHRRLEQILKGHYRLVYAAPERLRQPPFLYAMRRAGVNRLVIDEVHCVSVWGHDFRPDYLTIGQARRALGNVPILGLTATAPSRVRQDILQHLGSLESPLPPAMEEGSGNTVRVIAGDVTRPNLRFEVHRARNHDEKLRRLIAFCRAEPGSGIVYAGTRARCEELSALLRRYGVDATHYHAGIAERAGTQDDFMDGRTRVVVATVAFGLGIDKPDIRFIVHFVPPSSLEAYYQEAGRAGRDGLPARCLLMYAPSDRATLTRRARRDALTVGFLRAVYAAAKQRLGSSTSGRVAAADLERDVRADDTRVRVGLGFLEQAGLLRRGPDLPSAARVRLNLSHVPASSPDLVAFCQAARLRRGQSLAVDLGEVAHRADIPTGEVERLLLEWADQGWLEYRPAGRDLCLELLPPPSDAAGQMAALLERYEAIQGQCVDEITAYAETRRCRHGHINAYLGGRSIERCAVCDNCVEVKPPPEVGLPDEREQLLMVLRCASEAPWSWGKRTLVRILRGNEVARRGMPALRPEACASASFGVLAFRSETAVERMLDLLEEAGFLRARPIGGRGSVLDLTSAGAAALGSPADLDRLLRPREKHQIAKPVRRDEPGPEVDEALFQALRAWRLERARTQGVPPYVVFHDSHLRAIASAKPTTLEALGEVKGVGPHKLAQYGSEVIELVHQHLK